MRISVIIPTLNEAVNIVETLESIRNASDVEIIAVDGKSNDKTAELARSYGAKVITSTPSRAGQMNAGANVATGEILLFLHADTRLPECFDSHVRRIVVQPGVSAGAFPLKLDGISPGLRIIEQTANWRSKYLQMPYGDQAVFLKAKLFRDIRGFADIPIMEDFELVRRLRCRGLILLAPVPVITSARRWKELGIWRTTWINQLVIIAYCLSVPPSQIREWYYKTKHSDTS